MHLNGLIALLALGTAASAASTATNSTTGSKGPASKSNGSLYGFISMLNNKYQTAQFNRLLKSDAGYQPIIDMLNNTGAMTVFIPNDKALQFFLDRQVPDLQKGQYPPSTAMINNVSMLDIVKQHITTGRYATSSNNYPAMVKSSILTNSTIDHLGSGSPLLIDTNSTYSNFSDKSWRVANSKNIQWNVGNGWLSADVLQRDIPTNNGYLNVIDDVLQPPTSLRNTIDHNSEISQINNYINTHEQVGSYIDGLNNATLFLPNNDALNGTDLSTMSDDDGKAFLEKYVVNGVYYTSNWTSMVGKSGSNGIANLDTASGTPLPVSYNDGTFSVNNTANVTTPNILYNGGVVHIMNQVL
ncbi:FAS1 domain-containing protein, partial [Backusella circina FSU 941]